MSENELFARHGRSFEKNRFVYPVVSRRSGGISVGVNLNPDKVCNFDCIYCQVNRRSESDQRFVEQPQLLSELRSTLDLCVSERLYEHEPMQDTPPSLRRLNDIAFSGDGEPTTFQNFDELMQDCADLKGELGLGQVKMVLITNASMFHRDHVRRGLRVLDQNQGEIWAKLDAGTEGYYQRVDRTKISFQQVLDNILDAARMRPLVIQSLFMTIAGEPPSPEEIREFGARLEEIVDRGGQLQLVQIYTIARQPAESFVGPLPDKHVDQIVRQVCTQTGLVVRGFYGTAAW